MEYNEILETLKELSTQKLDKMHVTKDDPNYNETLKLDLYHYSDILKLCNLGPPPQKLLEIGLGYAYLAVLIRRTLKYEVTGIEQPYRQCINNPQWQNMLKKEEIQPYICDVTHDPLPFQNSTFNIVTCCEVIEHLPNPPKQLLKEIHRVLDPKGTLILTTPNNRRLRNIIQPARREHTQKIQLTEPAEDPYQPHRYIYFAGELTKLLEETGFIITKLHFSDCWDKTKGTKRKILLKFMPSLKSDIMVVAKKQ